MSTGFSIFVIVGTVISLIAFFLLLHMNRKIKNPGKTTGHNYDGIEEYDNPLPSWWYWMFVLTIVYAVGYLIYYPGLGNFPGIANWTKVGELEVNMQLADEKYGPIYAQYRDIPLDELSQNPEAMKMGRRIFASNCAVCHGANAKGSFGFPNLTDEEWQWGFDDEDIIATLTHGRNAFMMPWGDVLGDAGVSEVSEYVMQLSGREVDTEMATQGEAKFGMFCVSCHGPDGKGNKLFGAPNLTNERWLYGGSKLRIEYVVRHGRNGVMPAFGDRLGSDKVHIMAGYVKSLSSKSSSGEE